MKNKNLLIALSFIMAMVTLESFSLDAQPLLGREISYRKYVRQNDRRSREDVVRQAVGHSYAFLHVTIIDGGFQGKVMMSNGALIDYYHKWMSDSMRQNNPSYVDWATNAIINETSIDVTGTNLEYHKADGLVNWKGPKYKLLKKCIELCDKNIVDFNILATLFQWNIVLDVVDEELHLYFYPLEFRSNGKEP